MVNKSVNKWPNYSMNIMNIDNDMAKKNKYFCWNRKVRNLIYRILSFCAPLMRNSFFYGGVIIRIFFQSPKNFFRGVGIIRCQIFHDFQ